MANKIRVVELFAGVGGFRLGLERASNRFDVVWSNQWEPSTKVQHASDIYVKSFGPDNHHNRDISRVPTSDIPEHDLLVGGFPCQDYSVAKTLNQAKGLTGKKGVLWWEIYRIAEDKRPKYLFLENVDRLLKSPVKERGRDFAIMLASLADLGYAVEWRVINAADYGMPQRRRRIFILAYQEQTAAFQEAERINKPLDWIREEGIFAHAFPIKLRDFEVRREIVIAGELDEISESFRESIWVPRADRPLIHDDYENWGSEKTPFENAGLVFPGDQRRVWTIQSQASYDGPEVWLQDILIPESDVPPEYFINVNLDRWEYLKGSKRERRTNKATGFEYDYNEGPLLFPDPLERASRTIITGEGGPTPSRFKHVVQQNPPDGPYRRLTPVELERLNMFPDNHTAGVSDARRAFFMGNALVVGVVEKLAREIDAREVEAFHQASHP
jgi:DNA (cytosine-5)-methyltransferase 1